MHAFVTTGTKVLR